MDLFFLKYIYTIVGWKVFLITLYGIQVLQHRWKKWLDLNNYVEK